MWLGVDYSIVGIGVVSVEIGNHGEKVSVKAQGRNRYRPKGGNAKYASPQATNPLEDRAW